MNIPSPPETTGPVEYDPVFLNSRKEAIIIFGVWVVALLWSVPYCYINGYLDTFDVENISTIWGMPTWLFWGIAFPWLLADIFTIWFCFFYMADDDLGEVHEGDDVEDDFTEIADARKKDTNS